MYNVHDLHSTMHFMHPNYDHVTTIYAHKNPIKEMLIVRQSNLPKTQIKIGCLGYTCTCMYMYMHTLYVLYYTMLYFIGVHSSDVEVEAGQGHYLSDEHAQERLFRGTHTYTYMYMYMIIKSHICIILAT